jgi:2-oxoglutarate ferredoxin oxidoreductase subunit beta
MAYLGDGGAYSIGTQHLIHTALRNDNITVFVVNNLNYGMTGGQMAPTTLEHQPPTTTAPFGRKYKHLGHNLKGPELVESIAAKGALTARRTTANPVQLKLTIKKALSRQMEGKGLGFVEALSYCPTNWKTNAKETLEHLKKFEKEYPIFENIVKDE